MSADPSQLEGVAAVQCRGNFLFDPATHRDFLGGSTRPAGLSAAEMSMVVEAWRALVRPPITPTAIAALLLHLLLRPPLCWSCCCNWCRCCCWYCCWVLLLLPLPPLPQGQAAGA